MSYYRNTGGGRGGVRFRNTNPNSWTRGAYGLTIPMWAPNPLIAHYFTAASFSVLSTGPITLLATGVPHHCPVNVTFSRVNDDDLLNATITGTDQFGSVRSETVVLANPGYANGITKFAYMTVDSIVINSFTAGTDGSLNIGINAREQITGNRMGQSIQKIGLPVRLKTHRAVRGVSFLEMNAPIIGTGLKMSGFYPNWEDFDAGDRTTTLWAGFTLATSTPTYQSVATWDAAAVPAAVSVPSDFVDTDASTVRLPAYQPAAVPTDGSGHKVLIHIDPRYMVDNL